VRTALLVVMYTAVRERSTSSAAHSSTSTSAFVVVVFVVVAVWRLLTTSFNCLFASLTKLSQHTYHTYSKLLPWTLLDATCQRSDLTRLTTCFDWYSFRCRANMLAACKTIHSVVHSRCQASASTRVVCNVLQQLHSSYSLLCCISNLYATVNRRCYCDLISSSTKIFVHVHWA